MTRMRKEARHEFIKRKYPFMSQIEIAKYCGVTPRTIRRDVNALNLKGEINWVEEAFLDLMRSPNISDTLKFTVMCKLYGRLIDWRMRRQAKSNSQSGKVTVKIVEP